MQIASTDYLVNARGSNGALDRDRGRKVARCVDVRQIDEKRWNKFREYAVNWDERKRLLAFLGEVEARLATEGDVTVSDRTLRDWVEWAKAKAEALNPFGGGAVGMFETIAKVKQWS